jgi:hypothetical protein
MASTSFCPAWECCRPGLLPHVFVGHAACRRDHPRAASRRRTHRGAGARRAGNAAGAPALAAATAVGCGEPRVATSSNGAQGVRQPWGASSLERRPSPIKSPSPDPHLPPMAGGWQDQSPFVFGAQRCYGSGARSFHREGSGALLRGFVHEGSRTPVCPRRPAGGVRDGGHLPITARPVSGTMVFAWASGHQPGRREEETCAQGHPALARVGDLET